MGHIYSCNTHESLRLYLSSVQKIRSDSAPYHRNFSKSRPHLQAFDDPPSSEENSIETSANAVASNDAPIGTESWNEGFYDESRIFKEVGTDPELPFFVWGTLKP